MTDNKLLFSKEGFEFTKKSLHSYNLSFQITNENIILEKIIDFNLVKLICDLNNDVCDKFSIVMQNKDEAIVHLLLKHLFEEIGFPQWFVHLHITKTICKQFIEFTSHTIRTNEPTDEAELMPIETIKCKCEFISAHKLHFSCDIVIENKNGLVQVVEKMMGVVLFKIFKRVKQFIEKVTM